MGSKGNKRHQKRLATPGHLQIARKERSAGAFFINPRPGAHSKNFCLPLGHVLRDLLKLTKNNRESKFILNANKVLVDGKVKRDHRLPIGMMDVIEIPEISKTYRVLPSHKHGLIVSEITQDESKFKLCKVKNISNIKGGDFQLHLHDGRNILVKPEEISKYQTRGSVKISIPEQEILDYYPLAEGNQAIIEAGKNIGVAGQISKLTTRFGVNASVAEIESKTGETISTAYDYAFVIGTESSSIDLPME